MIERRLQRQLEKVAGRIRQVRLLLTWTTIWLAIAALAGLGHVLNGTSGLYMANAPLILLGVAVIIAALGGWLAYRSARNYQTLAQRVERTFPDLRSGLLAAVNQEPQLPDGQFGFMQTRVINYALQHAYANGWIRTVPMWLVLCAMTASLASMIMMLVSLVALASLDAPSLTVRLDVASGEIGNRLAPGQVEIEPGNAEIEKGTSLLVLARFGGQLPSDTTLVIKRGSNEVASVAMSKSLDDPVFGGRIADVSGPLSYHVAYGDVTTDTFQVTVFEYPRLVRANARLIYPDYTSREPKFVQDIRRVSAVVGTELTIICQLNKKVTSARLVPRQGETLELAFDEVVRPNDEESKAPPVYNYSTTWTLAKSQRFTLQLVDAQDRQNKQPPEIVVKVLPNNPPDLKLVMPARDVQVSPLEELDLKASVRDDYGVNAIGVTYEMAGSASHDVVLAEAIAGQQRLDFSHTVGFETLNAEPDQLLSYYFWAEDTGPDGQTRRTYSDMYFAEVRHFEEIFRQGQQPPNQSQQQQQQQQQSENGNQAQQLAELQKQIMNATWKLIRRETATSLSSQFESDVNLIEQSQSTALEQTDALAEELTDEQSKQYVEVVRNHMRDAISHLTAAHDATDVAPLRPSLSSQRLAYQALLKLRAREHEVVESQQQQQSGSQSSSSSQSRSQQQLQQLQLDEDENRYETQREAQSQQEQQDQETQHVLNRLRELARRQGDLNERLKDLQSALEAAETTLEREELERQLKRLREEQQQLMRDAEELESRMEEPGNQEQMNESREQLAETRENMRRASEALEEGQISRAVTAGTRAERELKELRDEFRKRSSDRFAEEMRDMREQARTLDEKQQDLSDRLDALANPDPTNNSLRDDGDREKIAEELGQQQGRLDDLLEQMTDTVMDAEETEPLLANELYDALRKTQQAELNRDLQSAEQSLNRGLLDDAIQREDIAGQGIQQLREGIERAAERVVGNETEALQRAQRELDQLVNELNDEVSRSTGQQRENSTGSPPGEQPGEQPGQEPGQEPGEWPGRQPGQEPGEQPGQQPGQPGEQPGQQPGQQPDGNPRTGGGGRDNNRFGGLDQLLNQGGLDEYREFSPIAGDDYRDWSDRMRDVEELLEVPELRAEAARIRDRARGFRLELKRHSKEPDWDKVIEQVANPLIELRDRIAEEVLKRTSKDALVPIDRDPVPPRFSDAVQKYFDRIGSGR